MALVQRSHLTLQSFANSGLGRVFVAGTLHNSRGIPLHSPRVYGRYALVYLLEGSGRFKSGNLPLMKCRPGDLLFIYPEIPHSYGPGPGERWNEFHLVFEGPIFDLWRRAGLLQPQQPLLHLRPIRQWQRRLEHIAAHDLPETSPGMARRVCRLQDFLADIAPEISAGPRPLPWLEKGMDILVNQPDRTPEEIALSLGLSYETFRKEFTREVGIPPGRFRLQRLIERARVLIAERNLSNKQVAEMLGFCDEFHFSRRFRQFTGQGPREFRRSVK